MNGTGGRASLRRLVAELAAIERPSASDGERVAAQRIAGELERHGARARVERELAHGGYWWPLGILNAAGAASGWTFARRPASPLRRLAALATGAFAASAIADDLGGARMWFRNRFLPRRATWNVVAEAGDMSAARTVVFVAHHDAAHSGLVFHPALARASRPRKGADRSLPILRAVWAGPALVTIAAALASPAFVALGTLVSTGAALVMADVGVRRSVPGANDNLSSVAAIVELARRLERRPIEGVRVLLVSTGSEESFSEGMRGFARRHFPRLARERTEVVCLECIGSRDLVLLEGEGMLRVRDYPAPAREALAGAAARAGVSVRRGWRSIAASDALVARRAGYHVATLGSVDEHMLPANYHWASDTEPNLNWDTIEEAISVCERYVRDRAA